MAAFWVIGVPGPLVIAAGALSWLHEYARARAGAAGVRSIGTVTIGERPTRVSVTLVGLLLAGGAGLLDRDLAAGTGTVAVAAWALLAVMGLTQLISTLRAILSA